MEAPPELGGERAHALHRRAAAPEVVAAVHVQRRIHVGGDHVVARQQLARRASHDDERRVTESVRPQRAGVGHFHRWSRNHIRRLEKVEARVERGVIVVHGAGHSHRPVHQTHRLEALAERSAHLVPDGVLDDPRPLSHEHCDQRVLALSLRPRAQHVEHRDVVGLQVRRHDDALEEGGHGSSERARARKRLWRGKRQQRDERTRRWRFHGRKCMWRFNIPFAKTTSCTRAAPAPRRSTRSARKSRFGGWRLGIGI